MRMQHMNRRQGLAFVARRVVRRRCGPAAGACAGAGAGALGRRVVVDNGLDAHAAAAAAAAGRRVVAGVRLGDAAVAGFTVAEGFAWAASFLAGPLVVCMCVSRQLMACM